MSIDIERIKSLDETDPLKQAADLFYLPEGTVYLDGNSLGAMPKAVVKNLEEVVQKEWAEDLIHSWNINNWFTRSQTIGDKIASLVGANKGEVVVSDCVSVNLFKLIVASLKKQKGKTRIVTELGNFPTNLYVMQGIESMLGADVELLAVERSEVKNNINEDTAIVVLTHTHYKTSEIWDMEELTGLAHEKGAHILWDLCHSAGIMPLELSALDVDMAVGCTYKYLNGGPGAPAFLYLANRLQGQMQQPVSGWWGHAKPFTFSDQYEPAGDIRQLQSGTQSILAFSALETGIDTALSVDMGEVRKKSQMLGRVFIELIGQQCPEVEIASPTEDELRGSHVSIYHEQGYAITQALRDHGVVVDFRAPDIIRFGFSPLYNSFEDTWKAVEALHSIIEKRSWDKEEYRQTATVT